MFRQIGSSELLLILAVLVLFFGAKKLPELARGSGRALRIFKDETQGLLEGEKSERGSVEVVETTREAASRE